MFIEVFRYFLKVILNYYFKFEKKSVPDPASPEITFKSILVFKLKDAHVIGNLSFYMSNLSLHIYHDTPFSLLTPHDIFRQLDSNHRLNVALK